MPLTLEMPADESTYDHPVYEAIGNAAAQAADLIDQGESEPVNDEIDKQVLDLDFNPSPSDPPVDVVIDNSNGKPQKKKRTRKAKAVDEKICLSADPATVQIDTPSVREQLAKIETSRSTRSMEIARVQAEYVEICLTINANEALIEDAKAEVKRLSEKQRSLAIELTRLRNDEQWQPKLPIVAESPPAAAAEVPPVEAATTPPVPTNFYPDAWRAASIDELGLPPKITETLTATNAETIGRLEDLRAEISQGRAKWPKGIGQAKITLIEDAVIKWLTANQNTSTPEAAQPAGNQSAISTGVHPTPTPQIESRPDSRPAAVFVWEDLTAEQQIAFIEQRAVEINDGTENCLARKHSSDERFYMSGFNAYGDANLGDCIYVPGIEMDDWIRGFLAAKNVDSYEPAVVQAEKEAVTELVSLDDL